MANRVLLNATINNLKKSRSQIEVSLSIAVKVKS